jgi:hypothetical protein
MAGHGFYKIVYRAEGRSSANWKIEVVDIKPSGLDVSLEAYCLTIDGEMHLSASRIEQLIDAETGEILGDAIEHFLCRWLDSEGGPGKVPLDRFIDALPVNGIGPLTSRVLAEAYRTWPEFWSELLALSTVAGTASTVDSLLAIPGVGQAVAEHLVEMARDERRRAFVLSLAARYLPAAHVEARGGALAGSRVVFTGTLNGMTRSEAKSLAEAAGALVAGSISRDTTFLIVGSGAGSKLARAEALGIAVIDEAEFLRRIGR